MARKKILQFLANCPMCKQYPVLTSRTGGWTADCSEKPTSDELCSIFRMQCEFSADSKIYPDPNSAVKDWNRMIRKATKIRGNDYAPMNTRLRSATKRTKQFVRELDDNNPWK